MTLAEKFKATIVVRAKSGPPASTEPPMPMLEPTTWHDTYGEALADIERVAAADPTFIHGSIEKFFVPSAQSDK